MSNSFSNPENNLKYLNIKEGSTVADFGAGVGHYVFHLSKGVGEDGMVYAIDVQKSAVEKLKSEIEEKNIKNIEVIWGDVENIGGSKLRSESLDAIILSNILFLVDSKSGLVHECYRALKPGGKVLLVDWSGSFGGIGPSSNMVVEADIAERLFENGGFSLKEKINLAMHHYGMVFEKR